MRPPPPPPRVCVSFPFTDWKAYISLNCYNVASKLGPVSTFERWTSAFPREASQSWKSRQKLARTQPNILRMDV